MSEETENWIGHVIGRNGMTMVDETGSSVVVVVVTVFVTVVVTVTLLVSFRIESFI